MRVRVCACVCVCVSEREPVVSRCPCEPFYRLTRTISGMEDEQRPKATRCLPITQAFSHRDSRSCACRTLAVGETEVEAILPELSTTSHVIKEYSLVRSVLRRLVLCVFGC